MMRYAQYRRTMGRQQGTAAVEMAVCAVLMSTILLGPILISQALLEATVAHRAAYNAAHLVATYPPLLRQGGANPADDAIAVLNQAFTDARLPATPFYVMCPDSPPSCNDPQLVPKQITVSFGMDVLDPASMYLNFGTTHVLIKSADRYAN
jgi:hypothetical protein